MKDNRIIQITADKHIPYLEGFFEPFANIKYLAGKDIDSSAVIHSNALLVRTRTQCNNNLLKNSSVEFIGSATIGTDHIDIDYCKKNNIQVVNAPGSNSNAVMQYIASCLIYIKDKDNKDFSDYTIGIVGVGNIGKKVEILSKKLGFKVLLCDPPRQRNEKNNQFYSLDELIEKSDIITFHTPLTYDGQDSTYHMINDTLLKNSKPNVWIINTSRGEVGDTNALINYKCDKRYIFDVWENEPSINLDLFSLCEIATPHIAGYSLEGKMNATKVLVNTMAEYFSLPIKNVEKQILSQVTYKPKSIIDCSSIEEAILSAYDVKKDHQKFKTDPLNMENFRQTYIYRREFSYYYINCENKNILNTLDQLGFNKNS